MLLQCIFYEAVHFSVYIRMLEVDLICLNAAYDVFLFIFAMNEANVEMIEPTAALLLVVHC